MKFSHAMISLLLLWCLPMFLLSVYLNNIYFDVAMTVAGIFVGWYWRRITDAFVRWARS